WSVAASLVTLAVALMDMSETAGLSAFVMFFGGYSSVIAQVLFWRRKTILVRGLDLLGETMAQVENSTDPALQARARQHARIHRVCRSLYLIFGWTTVALIIRLSVLLPPRWARRPARYFSVLSGLPEDSCFVFLHAAKTVGEVSGSLCCLTAFYSFVPCVLLVYTSCAFLHQAVGQVLQ
ncbi:Odorant receptor 80, partial [Frankliniella occidentalis]